MTAPARGPSDVDSGRSGGGLTSKVGPLPVWGWVALAAAGGIAVLLWLQSRKKAAAPGDTSTAATGSVSPSTADVANLQDQLATVVSQIRDLQGGNSQPAPGTPTDSGTYYFAIQGDSSPSTRYVGIPGVGYYAAPYAGAVSFLQGHPNTIDLGTIPQGTAQTRFGPLLPWETIGSGNNHIMQPLGGHS